MEEGVALAKEMEKAGADAIHCRAQIYGIAKVLLSLTVSSIRNPTHWYSICFRLGLEPQRPRRYLYSHHGC
jgi:hypothetical protein